MTRVGCWRGGKAIVCLFFFYVQRAVDRRFGVAPLLDTKLLLLLLQARVMSAVVIIYL